MYTGRDQFGGKGAGAIATEYSFDVVSRVDMAEVQNAVQQAGKEVATRYDLRGAGAAIALDAKAGTVTLTAADAQPLGSLLELLQQRLAKRGVSLRAVQAGEPQPASGGTLRQVLTFQQGIPTEKGKELVRALRDAKLKVTAQLQDDQVRVNGAKKDDLQAAIALLKGADIGLDLQFVNYR